MGCFLEKRTGNFYNKKTCNDSRHVTFSFLEMKFYYLVIQRYKKTKFLVTKSKVLELFKGLDSRDIPSPYTPRGLCSAREQQALSRDKCPGKAGVPFDHV